MHIEQKINIHNRFDVEVRDAKTGELKQRATGFNIVLDQMWTRLCGGSSYFVNIHFGTGGGTLSPSRTSLFTHLGTKTAADEEQVKALPVSRWKRKIVLNPEEFVGSTITEVGIAFGSTASNLVTHAMLKDSEGNPISITKTDLDVVTIYATVFVTINNAASITMLGMPASNQLVNYLVGGGSSPAGSFGLSERDNAFARIGSTSNATWTSDVPNKKRKTNIQRFGTTVGNGHVKALEFTNLFSLELPADGIFAGQPYVNVNLGVGDGVKQNFQLPSRNVKSESIVTYVDGIATAKTIEISRCGVQASAALATLPRAVNSITAKGSRVFVGVASGASATVHTILVYQITSNGLEFETSFGVRTGVADVAPYLLKASDDSNTLLAVYNHMAPYVQVFKYQSGEWAQFDFNISSAVYGGAITADGNTIAYGQGTNFKIFDFINDEWVFRGDVPVPSTAFMVDFTPSGLTMACGTTATTNNVKVTDLVGGTWVDRSMSGLISGGACRSLSISTDGLRIAYSMDSSPRKFIVADWNGSSWNSIELPNPTDNPEQQISMSRNGDLVIRSNGKAYSKIIGGWAELDMTSVTAGMAVPTMAFLEGTNKVYGVVNSPKTIHEFSIPEIITDVKFSAPVITGKVVTADYTVDGVHKTNQYVIDASFAITFGEGA